MSKDYIELSLSHFHPTVLHEYIQRMTLRPLCQGLNRSWADSLSGSYWYNQSPHHLKQCQAFSVTLSITSHIINSINIKHMHLIKVILYLVDSDHSYLLCKSHSL